MHCCKRHFRSQEQLEVLLDDPNKPLDFTRRTTREQRRKQGFLLLMQASLAELPEERMHFLNRDDTTWIAFIFGAEGLDHVRQPTRYRHEKQEQPRSNLSECCREVPRASSLL